MNTYEYTHLVQFNKILRFYVIFKRIRRIFWRVAAVAGIVLLYIGLRNNDHVDVHLSASGAAFNLPLYLSAAVILLPVITKALLLSTWTSFASANKFTEQNDSESQPGETPEATKQRTDEANPTSFIKKKSWLWTSTLLVPAGSEQLLGFKIVMRKVGGLLRWREVKSDILVQIPLAHAVPHFVCSNHRRPTKLSRNNLFESYRGVRRYKLEGEFGKHFDLLAPEQNYQDALVLFTPDVMAAVLDYLPDYADLELKGKSCFVVVPETILTPEKFEDLLRSVSHFAPQLAKQVRSLS